MNSALLVIGHVWIFLRWINPDITKVGIKRDDYGSTLRHSQPSSMTHPRLGVDFRQQRQKPSCVFPIVVSTISYTRILTTIGTTFIYRVSKSFVPADQFFPIQKGSSGDLKTLFIYIRLRE